jgi:protein-disulfide isomerase
MNRIIAISAAALGLLLATSSISLAAEAADSWVPPASYVDPVTNLSFDIVVGDAKAPVTIYEYASLTCPHCRAWQELAADDVRKEWIDTGKAKLVYRHFPLDQSALAAALAVECLPTEKRYDAVKLFFKTQQQWAGKLPALVGILKESLGPGFTLKPGMDFEASLQACMAAKDFPQHAMQAMLDAGQNGINSTPTFIVNGEHVKGAVPAAELGAVIARKYAEATNARPGGK